MKKMRITRHEEFEVAHVLPNYDGGCGNLHGHTYKIEVTVEGPQTGVFDMVMDFSDLKRAIKAIVPDHRFICSDYASPDKSDLEHEITKVLDAFNIQYVVYPFVTTAENMVTYFAEMIEHYIQNEMEYKDVEVVECKLWETTNSYAHYIKPQRIIKSVNLSGEDLAKAVADSNAKGAVMMSAGGM